MHSLQYKGHITTDPPVKDFPMNIRITHDKLYSAKSITTSYPKFICVALLEMIYLTGKDGMQPL